MKKEPRDSKIKASNAFSITLITVAIVATFINIILCVRGITIFC